jgi:hypothetical protein
MDISVSEKSSLIIKASPYISTWRPKTSLIYKKRICRFRYGKVH